MSALRGNTMRYGLIMPEVFPFGLFIKRIEQTKTSDESGGENIFTVELTDHSRRQFKVRNGAKGDTGDAAGIKEITASIDNGIGTPSVSVSSTGTGTEKSVHFIFKNLKGETGNIALTEEVKQHISQSVASANQYTDDAIKGVSQSIDTGDTNTLQAAKKYADQNVQAETQARAQGDMDMLADAKRYINDLLIKIFQNGYIQWPGMPTPDTLFTFEGYRWAEVNYDGCFFRAKGKDANPFNGDEQGDAIRNIKGLVGIEGGVNPSGPFYIESPSPKNVEAWQTAAQEYTTESTCFDASRIVPTAEENRTRNRTFIIWKLEKIEG